MFENKNLELYVGILTPFCQFKLHPATAGFPITFSVLIPKICMSKIVNRILPLPGIIIYIYAC